MKQMRTAQPVLLMACLCAGLLFDPAGFLRMALLCAVIHESGHVLVYCLCTRSFPKLHMSPGGIALSKTAPMTLAQENLMLAAGPFANFAFAAILYLRLMQTASYGVYFLAAVSLCMGIYNLLPIGVLDGARLLQNMTPPHRVGMLYKAQQSLLILFCAVVLGLALCTRLPTAARITAVLAPLYLLAQSFFT